MQDRDVPPDLEMVGTRRVLTQALDACNELGRVLANTVLVKNELAAQAAKLSAAFEVASNSRDLWRQRAYDAGWRPADPDAPVHLADNPHGCPCGDEDSTLILSQVRQ